MAEATESWAVTLAVSYGDVFEEFCRHLGFLDLIKLGMACRAFGEINGPRDMMRRRGCLRKEMRDVDLQLLHHRSPLLKHRASGLLTTECYYCTRMRPKDLFILCHRRGRFAPEPSCCGRIAIVREDGVRVMPVICYFELRDPWNPLSSLEKMPREGMSCIARHVDYDDAINLGMVSRWMNRKVKPAELVPFHERYRFTNKLFWRQEPRA